MRNDKPNLLKEVIAPVAKSVKAATFLGAASALFYASALTAFAFSLSNLQNSKINFTLLGTALALILCEFFARKAAFGISHKAAFDLERILRLNLSRHLAAVPYGEALNLGAGKIKKIMFDDVKNLHAFTADMTPMIGRSAASALACTVCVLILEPRLLPVVLIMPFLGIAAMRLALRGGAENLKKYENAQSAVGSSIIEFIQAMPVLRTFDGGSGSFGRFDNALKEFDANLRTWIKGSSAPTRIGVTLLSPVPTLFALSAVGSYSVLDGSLDIGRLAGVLMLGCAVVDSLLPLMLVSKFAQISKLAASEILEVMSIAALPICASPRVPVSNDIEFRNVNFKYKGKDEFTLKNVNFKANAGSVTALVGASGAGKSTVAMLAARFYDVSEGEILIGGVNIKEIAPSNLSILVSFVFQDTFLFNESIYENIAKAKPGALKDEVIAVAKAANIHEFIQSLPQGYDTPAGEKGAKLSGGQKQRITIARAILKDAPIIILDEATAFIDPQSEEQIIKAVSNLIKNKTLIVVAHRLSTIKNADQILVFEGGEIVQSGTHDELIKGGAYKKLWDDDESAQIWRYGGNNEA
jgi:lipid A export ATP-binding/permease protein msbA